MPYTDSCSLKPLVLTLGNYCPFFQIVLLDCFVKLPSVRHLLSVSPTCPSIFYNCHLTLKLFCFPVEVLPLDFLSR